jgi:hypothetical protein
VSLANAVTVLANAVTILPKDSIFFPNAVAPEEDMPLFVLPNLFTISPNFSTCLPNVSENLLSAAVLDSSFLDSVFFFEYRKFLI